MVTTGSLARDLSVSLARAEALGDAIERLDQVAVVEDVFFDSQEWRLARRRFAGRLERDCVLRARPRSRRQRYGRRGGTHETGLLAHEPVNGRLDLNLPARQIARGAEGNQQRGVLLVAVGCRLAGDDHRPGPENLAHLPALRRGDLDRRGGACVAGVLPVDVPLRRDRELEGDENRLARMNGLRARVSSAPRRGRRRRPARTPRALPSPQRRPRGETGTFDRGCCVILLPFQEMRRPYTPHSEPGPHHAFRVARPPRRPGHPSRT